ncbi:7008_t:CDS:2 [Funneliformis mosseae]|uniref:7008_t:CDS:1 n=1 Tax=Funneliformis mosseae TaxID=27381 RepID=A0A9N9EKX6_FUNMO|nr:7008_t:CDS:2 [Funneliformis mosseae]
MRYSKGSQKGRILSLYLQNIALSNIEDTLYKDLHQKVQELDHKNKQLIHLKDQKKHYISTIHLLVQRSITISLVVFKNYVKSLFKENKKQYSANTVWMFLIREPPKTWLLPYRTA